KRYWRLDFSKKLNLSEKEWMKVIEEKLKEAVKIRLRSDVPLGAHLSGGTDSSTIVAFMALQMKEPVKTFSVGFKESKYNELPFARMVAQRYKTEHTEIIVEPKMIEILPKLVYQYEEPYADSSALPTWYLCQETKKYVTVALNGDGGDENFAGYDRYSAFKLYLKFKFLPGKKIFQKLSNFLWQKTKIPIFRKAWRFFSAYQGKPISFYLRLIGYFQEEEKKEIYDEKLLELIQESRKEKFLEEIFEEGKNFSKMDQIFYTDINSYLPDDLLVKVDIASMTHSLEVRSPFLDYEFMELCAKIPEDLKIKGFNKKYIFKKLIQKYLPKECIFRPKMGFGVPLDDWFKGELENYLRENLLEKNFLNFGFKKEGIEKLISEHKKGIKNTSYKIWALLILKFWLEIFFKNYKEKNEN
ncbi:MAG: asparagine synthase C-terminal domain-containing protein, partial [candidate division WOR-3 bacterium]